MITAKCVLAAAIAITTGGLVAAQDFPTKSIQLVVPAAPGGSPDILARIIAPALSARLGQPVTVDNRPGGAGNTPTSFFQGRPHPRLPPQPGRNSTSRFSNGVQLLGADAILRILAAVSFLHQV